MTLQGTHGVEELIPTDDALDTHGWRPHASDRHHQSIIGECQRIDHSNALALLQKFASVELDGIGIAPPPVPSTLAPISSASRSSGVMYPCDVHCPSVPLAPSLRSQLQVSHRFHTKAQRITGEIGQGISSTSITCTVSGCAPAVMARSTASALAWARASSRERVPSVTVWSTSPLIWAIAAPTAFAT